MLRRKQPSAIAPAIIALAFAAGAVWVWAASGGNGTRAQQYDAAPVCATAGTQGCRRELQATVTDSYVAGGKTRFRYVDVLFAGADTGHIKLNGSYSTAGFAAGDPVQVEYFGGQPVLVVRADGATYPTVHNPDVEWRSDRIFAAALGSVALIFWCVAFWRMRRSSRPAQAGAPSMA